MDVLINIFEFVLRFLIRKKTYYFIPDEIHYRCVIPDGKANLLVVCEDGCLPAYQKPMKSGLRKPAG